ncbi:monovalent cation/H(+) antiporter subunit G [Nisaea nitritireducens]|uniref:monovalent cation/H(+) antiporter subunit G n=1 Tax=Nisaea nitritireducens TaxID=568392 RepID=UPI001865B4D3|nr:monovalent cation/H(+) antiporter subunit G [Nisaea nitritireducens]
MEMIIDLASWAFILAGVFFIFTGTLGMLRLPDFYTRLHAAGITDTLGTELLLIAMMLQAGWSIVTVKLLMISLFIFFTSPTATHALANAANAVGLRPFGVPEADLRPKTTEKA